MLDSMFDGLEDFKQTLLTLLMLIIPKRVREILKRTQRGLIKWTSSCSSQLRHVRAASQRFAEIMNKFPNVRSSLAAHTEQNILAIHFEDLEIIDFSIP